MHSNRIMDRTVETASYAGGGVSILAALTLTDVGILIGIVTAVLTFAANLIYQFRKDKREEVLHQIQVKKLTSEDTCST